MKKAEVIERYGEEEYKRRLETQREKRSKAGCIKLYGEEAYAEMAKKRSEGRPKLNKAEYIERYGQDAYDQMLARRREKQKKDAYIAEHGEEAWQKILDRGQDWRLKNPEEAKASAKNWRQTHPEKQRMYRHKSNRKGGRLYDRKLKYMTTGLQGERNNIRRRHSRHWQKYKMIIAPASVLHHEWIDGTAEYRGIALVEKDQHQHGIIDVIEILDGKITLLSEDKINKRGEKTDESQIKAFVV